MKPRNESKHKREFELYLIDRFKDMGLVKEYRFCKRRWRFDYALPDYNIAFEYDGGAFSGGRHNRGAGMIKDNEKINTAQLLGWTVYKVCTGQSYTQLIDELMEKL